jgi:ERCC4-type nuclease
MSETEPPFEVIVDSREKKPYEFADFNHSVMTNALRTGDYTIEGLEEIFSVERKTLDDFLKSITWERERFEAEVKRASTMVAFIVLIEANKREITNWDYRRDVHPNSVLATIESWERKYNVEFRWGCNRERSEEITIEILTEWHEAYQNMAR